MRVLLVSDAWLPQVNGVVRTLLALVRELKAMGHEVATITPDLFLTIPCPGYAEIRLALFPGRKVPRLIEAARPDAIHIATEGPLGIAARRWCLRNDYAFTTAFHTRFPEYLAARVAVPERFTYAMLRRFHEPSRGVMVATESMRRVLADNGFGNLRPWSRGVDADAFDPERRDDQFAGLPRPIFLSVGRIAVEKNLPAFLSLDLPGSKVVIGDGPALPDLKRRFPDTHFLGRRENGMLARHYASADVFVFPSRTDTFGLVLLESLASGTPVAAFPVPGPLDVIGVGGAGVLDADLRQASIAALDVSRDLCRAFALNFTWENCARQFLENLTIARA